MAHAARWLYSALAWAAQPLLRRKLRRRAVAEPGYARHVGERFGRYPPQLDSLAPGGSSDPDARLVWIHAVSLGETRAAAILLAELRRQRPGMRLLLTHGTATGRAEGEKLLHPGDLQVWQPWDTPAAVARFLRQFRPAIGILMETEVWPNLVAGCRRRGIPLVLANARLSDKSLRQARRMAWLARPAYAALAAVWAQTEADAARLRSLGASVQGVFGNLKFDVVPDAAQLAQGRQWRAQSPRPVVLLASSREGEEAMWLEEIQPKRALAQSAPACAAIDSEARLSSAAVQWLIVPRHPQRFDTVAQLLRDAGLVVSRRSHWATQPEGADVWLGDSLGEMALYYGLADVALLGGSFAPLGGQNLIEAAACACPVVLGPHTFNFAEAAELACAAGAAERVADLGQGVEAACALALDAPRLDRARAQAAGFARTHRGAAQATAAAVAALLAAAATDKS
ncbi:3-deoxy-D-manno-octulosonic acid transferase [Acidovorax sp. SRB_14]|uniref:3-deoxy-D-manno-octulosonic acid transferase n=1 Tax=unclassified Acidovorax TaxID=2684926 RepID=UPI00145F394D|nr:MULTISPECIES: 3-deoxy-D-manno-octulosonic acid transferase [unclassified Acidovorax]NMM77966.1 3-deoxy-D-manno-octulosonic acid transferase [Acidovorax sp. SRB_24]NMM77993.1 3-deoxy-D-manno-octulosonic acid transferase [Acidovorax sp. SRB_24]NMM79419.1 3-deoxy-D-manno-octulosonic acid transferase [Acidovorax sp. SRB_14]